MSSQDLLGLDSGSDKSLQGLPGTPGWGPGLDPEPRSPSPTSSSVCMPTCPGRVWAFCTQDWARAALCPGTPARRARFWKEARRWFRGRPSAGSDGGRAGPRRGDAGQGRPHTARPGGGEGSCAPTWALCPACARAPHPRSGPPALHRSGPGPALGLPVSVWPRVTHSLTSVCTMGTTDLPPSRVRWTLGTHIECPVTVTVT